MEEFSALSEEQRKVADVIHKIIQNYKKDPKDRKQTIAYFQERIRRLEEAWATFDINDTRMRLFDPIPADDAYFQEDFYTKTQELVNAFSEELQAAMLTIRPIPQIAANHEVRITDSGEQKTTSNLGPIMRKQGAIISSLKRLLNGTTIQEAPDQAIAAIKKLWQQAEDIHFKLWEECADPIKEGYNMEDYIQTEDTVHQKLAMLANSREQTTNNNRRMAEVKMPKISIDKFDGNYLKWQTFSDLFTRMVHDQEMPTIQKMWYLKTNVEGEAERLIRHLSLTESNYETAWNILQDRFNNKKVLMSTLINKILVQPKLNSEAKAIKEFHDVIRESLAAIYNMGIDTSKWDPLLSQILIQKLDRQSHLLFEQSQKDPRALQTTQELLSFLQNRFQTLEIIIGKEKPRSTTSAAANNKTDNAGRTCKVCSKEGHPLYYCGKFLKMSVAERLKWTQSHKLCVNCFKDDHRAKECSSRCCSKCSKKHNTLLHLENSATSNSATKASQKPTNATPSAASAEQQRCTASTTEMATVAASNQPPNSHKYILLATARVIITGNNGRSCEFRALLDSGSQINIVTERLVKKLALAPSESSLCIEGIGRRTRNATQRVNVKLNSIHGNFTTRIEAVVLPNIVSPQPTQTMDTSKWPLPLNINLADPRFNQTGKIDILIGAEFYHQLMRSEQISFNNRLPVLQNTVLGWIVTGKVDIENNMPHATCGVFTGEETAISQILERFWKIDEADEPQRQMTASEKECENHFAQTVARANDGRYIVQLPRLENASALGESHQTALQRFFSLEKRLSKDTNIRELYTKFMTEYESLGHMKEVNIKDISTPKYFMPHHCVLKPESTTTKLRVVFDGSAKTSTGLALNDVLHAGPTVQSELFSILLRFRMHRFVFTADIEKMYRQILVQDTDQNLQLIIWRKDPSEPIKYYRLTTVTYGTTSAPYLATKCLQHLAKISMDKYPIGAPILHDDFYVDDCLSGADKMSIALEAKTQLTSMLREAGFNLRKWCANHPQLLAGIPVEDQEISLDFNSETNHAQKALGVIWLPRTDQLCGRSYINITSKPSTKRSVCSDLGRLFDPLGIFGPVIVRAKIFTQRLWQLKLTWDEELPNNMQQEWSQFQKSINTLNDVKTPRHIFNHKLIHSETMQLHTFVDASEQAYGAATYIRSFTKEGTLIVNLLCAKSRVAPIKKQTLPRLELCAAVLGVELTQRVKRDLKRPDMSTFFWTDSEIVLSWINSSSSAYYTFVANRVSKIQQLSCSKQWRHVPSKENPADVLSRGLAPEQLSSCNIWFYGPLFLYGKESQWPQIFSKNCRNSSDIEKKQTQIVSLVTEQKGLGEILNQIDHRNSFKFLQRTVAYVLRFKNAIKKGQQTKNQQLSLTPLELYSSLQFIVRALQQSELINDINNVKACKTVNASSQLNGSTPFIDEYDILRVGGRLKEAAITYDAKYPMVLPYNNPIVKLLFKMKHEEHAHCGPQALLNIIKQQFWAINGKVTARNTFQKCIRCTRAKPHLMTQLMGNLPADRITASRPFFKAGVDYCGPFWVHYKGRGRKPYKAYLAVFCCFATKAVHLELVSDLTTEAFIGALKRFIGRRGRCQTLYSDNATNFVGTKNQLQELETAIYSKTAQNAIRRASSDHGIEFKFIPPRAPHFGGLWEAAVKSAKHLLIKRMANLSFTYEEFETVIIEIEAILNSRPITPMSSNPNDLTALTPGHFLVGEPLTSQVNPHVAPLNTTLTNRWRLVTNFKEEFWKRWSQEYLNELQYRHKWRSQNQNIKEGDMVIIKDDNTPTMKWPLGRVTQLYKGSDNLVRVVDVKTASGTCKRPLHKLAPLFKEEKKTELLVTPQKRRLDEISPPKRRLGSNNSIVTTIIVSLLLLPLAFAVNVTQFEQNPGIFFDGIGTAKLISGNWKIIVYYDLNPIWSRNKILEEGMSTLTKLCDGTMDKSCDSLILHLKQTAEELIQEEDLITPVRPRRAALDIVGNMAHALFGVLDSNYAEDMSKTISHVQQNEDFLLHLIKNQTSVIDATINILKDDASSTKQHIIHLQDTISRELNQVEREQAHLQRSQHITSLALQLNMLVSDLQRIQTELINALTHSNHGNISPMILTPQQLRREISNIIGHLPIGSTLPTDDSDLLHLYEIMNIKGAVTKAHIIFKIEIPLVNHQSFELFHLIPIPTWINNTMILLKPRAQFLAVSNHRDQYVILSTTDHNKCTTIIDDIFLCPNLHATIAKNSGSYSCEIALFNNKTSPNCKVEHLYNNISLISTHQPNQWIFATKRTTELTAVCGNDIQEISIQSSGMLSIEPNCILKGGFLTIQGHEVTSTVVHTAFPAFGNLTAVGEPVEVKRVFNLDTNHVNSKLDQLTKLQQQLQQNIQLPAELYPSVSHQVVSYSAFILIIIGLLTFVICYCKKHCQHKRLTIQTPPQPSPRRNCPNYDTDVEVC